MTNTKIQNFMTELGQLALLVGAVVLAVVATNHILKKESQPFGNLSSGLVAESNPESEEIPPQNGLLDNIETEAESEAPITAIETTPPPAPPTLSDQLKQSIPAEANALYAGIDPTVKRLIPQYQVVGFVMGMPWQILPALQLRESGRGMSDQRSILNGGALKPATPGDNTGISPFGQDLFTAATHFKVNAKKIAGIDIKADGNTLDEMKRAFLIYNRSSSPQDPNLSPYVMNFLDSAHANMVWPAGDPVAKIFGNNHRDGNPGALTTYIYYGGPITANAPPTQ